MDILTFVSWVVGGVTAFLGARWGAVAADQLARKQREQETLKKRETLLELLSRQLEYVREPLAPYNPGKVTQRCTYNLTALPQLIDGGVLEYGQHKEMLLLLLELQRFVDRYNDFARDLVLAQQQIPDSGHAQLHDHLVKYQNAILKAADDFCQHLTSLMDETKKQLTT